jgi:putative ABC transport system substrate-binding protein
MIRRREFIAGLGSAAAWPVVARAQQPAMPMIGWLSERTAAADALAVLPAFRRALNAQGYVEGRNVTIEYRYAEARLDRLPALAADLVRRRAAVIVTVGGVPAARAVQAVSATIPIVYFGGDPVKAGFVASLNRPGGNVTGAIAFQGRVVGKRLGLLHDLLPRATTIAVLVNPADEQTADVTADVQDAARALGLQTRIVNASTERDLDTAFATLAQMRPDALFVEADPLFFTHADRLVAAAARLALPASYFRREFVAAGGLMGYAASIEGIARVNGEYAGRILKGEKPGDLPVQQATKFELVLNLKTAKTLGLEVPTSMLLLADEVIE